VATHFSRLLRHAWVTVGLFLFSGHHRGNRSSSAHTLEETETKLHRFHDRVIEKKIDAVLFEMLFFSIKISDCLRCNLCSANIHKWTWRPMIYARLQRTNLRNALSLNSITHFSSYHIYIYIYIYIYIITFPVLFRSVC
jgi:hypothetical protein